LGSVISEIQCSVCGYEQAYIDYYYKSNEEYIFCSRCGSSFSVNIINRPKNDEYPDDWEPKYKNTKHITKHAYAIGKTRGISSCGGLKTKDLNNFKQVIKKKLYKKEIKHAHYTFEQNGKWFIKDLVTQKTKKFKLSGC